MISHAKFLNPAKIRANLEKRYQDIGATAQISAFEKNITQFIEKSAFKPVSLITYPKTVEAGLNLLNEENVIFPSGLGGPPPSVTPYSYLSATPIKGLSLRIKLEYVEGGTKTSFGYWGYSLGSNENWKIAEYDYVDNFQVFDVIESGKPCNLRLVFLEGNNLKIRISYFENNDLVTTRTRIITVN